MRASVCTTWVKSAGRSGRWAGGSYRYTQTFQSLITRKGPRGEAIAAAGRVDILVNNAGVTPVYPAADYPEAEFDRVMNVNVKALFLLTQELGRHMVENHYGRIINVCSVQSYKGGQLVSAYAASKHAVAGLTRAFANEWGGYGVTVNGIAPGFMVTDNTALLRTQKEAVAALTAQIPVGRWGEPEDLMGPVVFLASESSRYVNGHLLVPTAAI